MRKVCVLYEDQRGPRKGFGLHELVKACVCDVLGESNPWLVHQALGDCRPMKGAANLLEACRQDVDLIASDGRSVIAVFDNDKIRDLLKLPPNASEERIEQKIREGGRDTRRLSIILLKQNMESVIEAAKACDPSIDSNRIELALRKKDPLERDALLTGLTGELMRSIRECILGKMPSLRSLIDLLCREVRPVSKGRKKPSPPGRRSTSPRRAREAGP
jgi:hypothetical protein